MSPCIGMMSDRLTLQIGKRRPIMVIGCTGLWFVDWYLKDHNSRVITNYVSI